MKKFSHRQKLFMILAVALVAVLLQYAFKQALAAQILVTIVGAGIALSMLIEMIHTLKSGRYGVDLLAIIAVVSTLSVGVLGRYGDFSNAGRWRRFGRLCLS